MFGYPGEKYVWAATAVACIFILLNIAGAV